MIEVYIIFNFERLLSKLLSHESYINKTMNLFDRTFVFGSASCLDRFSIKTLLIK